MALHSAALFRVVAVVLLMEAISSMAVVSTNRQNRTDNLTLPRLNDKFGNGNNGNTHSAQVVNNDCTVLPVYVGHRTTDTLDAQMPVRYENSFETNACSSVPNYLGEEDGPLPTTISTYRPSSSASSGLKVSDGQSNLQNIPPKNISEDNSKLEPRSSDLNTRQTDWTRKSVYPTTRSDSVTFVVEELKKKVEFLNKRADRLSVHLNEMEQTMSRQIDTTGARHVQTLIDLKDIQEQLQPLGDTYRSSILFDSRNGCPERFTQFPAKKKSTKSNCFWFSNFVGSWAEAYTYCRMMGSNLAMVNNRYLRRFVTNEVKKRRGKFYFLGGTDLPKEGAWRWFSARKHFFHRMWKKREPNNAAGAEHCLAISRKNKWVDVKCDRRINFICQINLSSADQGR